MRKEPRRINSAHVLAAVALFVALGAGAYAAGLKKNSVKSKQIKDGQVLNRDLGNGAVDAAKLADGAVNSAKIADGAVGAADLGPGLGLNCPAATTYVQGVCIEANSRVTNNYATAENDCEDEGKRLPAQSELYSYAIRPGVNFNGTEWALEWRAGNVLTIRDDVTGTTPESLGDVGTNPYRCAAIP